MTAVPADYLTSMDRTAVSVGHRGEAPGDERAFWMARPLGERLEAVELLRQRFWGYEEDSVRLQRVLEIVERT